MQDAITLAGYVVALRSLRYDSLADLVLSERWKAAKIVHAFRTISISRKAPQSLALVLLTGCAARWRLRPEGHSGQPEIGLAAEALSRLPKLHQVRDLKSAQLKAAEITEERLPLIERLAAEIEAARQPDFECEDEPSDNRGEIDKRIRHHVASADLAGV